MNDCLRSRIEWSDQQLIREVISVLATQGWEKPVEENDKLKGNRLLTRFAIPLQGAHADCSKIKEELRSLVHYGV